MTKKTIMGIVDFKEISQGNISNGNQDEFELFAREFLLAIGYKIIEDPSRGADGGKDLIVSKQTENGDEVNFLVSCKHVAFSSAKSVSPKVEFNIIDRVISNKCDGFIGFYSGITTSGLSNIINGIKTNICIEIFDHKRIERELVNNINLNSVFQSFFQESYKKCIDITAYGTSEKLLEYYLKNYKIIYDTYKNIFGTLTEMVFKIKKFEGFERAIKDSGYQKIILDDLVSKFMTFKPYKHANYQGGSIKLSIEEYIPKEIKYLHKIDVGKKCKMTTVSFGDLSENRYTSNKNPWCIFIYPNHIVGCENAFLVLEEFFTDIKKIL